MKLKVPVGVGALLLAVISCAVFTAGGKDAPAEAQRAAAPEVQARIGGVQNVEKLYPENQSDRTFKMDITAWDESEDMLSEPVNVLLCLEMAERMGWLAGSPIDNHCYVKGVEHPGIEGVQLFAIDKGEYKPLVNRENTWYVDGAGKPVGETTGKDGETVSKFTIDVYEKGECETRLERVRKTACNFIDRLSQKSPGSRVSLIFYGTLTGEENSVKLDTEGVELLKSRIHSMESESDKSVPLPLAKAFYTLDENGSRNITVNLSCTPFEKSGDTEYPEDVLKKLDMYYFIDVEKKLGERSFSFVPPGKTFRDNPAEIFEKVFSDIMSENSAVITYSLDPRFTVTEKCRNELEEDFSASVTEEEGKKTSIRFSAVLPRAGEEAGWAKELEITAKNDFIGGNNIPLGSASISKDGQTMFEYAGIHVNVPVKFHVSQADASIFKGEPIPLNFGGAGVAESMAGAAGYQFYGMGETGTLNYRWSDQEGRDVGPTEELGGIIPAENTVYTLNVTFTPGEEARADSVGKPAVAATLSGNYRIKVKPGSVIGSCRIKAEHFEGRIFTFILEGESVTEYQSVRFTGKEAADENGFAKLSAEFKDLPSGQYTLSCQSSLENDIITVTDFDNASASEGKAVLSIGVDESGATVSRCRAEFTVESLENTAAATDYYQAAFD